VTNLDDITRWWQERATFSFEIKPLLFPASNPGPVRTRAGLKPWPSPHQGGPPTLGQYDITPHCSDRASVVLQHPGGKMEFITPKENGAFGVQSSFRPVIGISPGFCDEKTPCLINEGFALEHDADPSSCAFVLDGTCSKNKRQLLESVKNARGPLLRFARWPRGFRSALAVSADIDAITLWDFVRRARHFTHMQEDR